MTGSVAFGGEAGVVVVPCPLEAGSESDGKVCWAVVAFTEERFTESGVGLADVPLSDMGLCWAARALPLFMAAASKLKDERDLELFAPSPADFALS